MTEKRFSYRYNSDKDGSEFEIIDLDKDEYYPMIETIETVVMALVDCLNNLHDENEQLKSENERLQHFESLYRQKTLQLEKKYNRIIDLINEKIKETENDLNCSVKAGMPTSAMYSEIELLEALRKEIEE